MTRSAAALRAFLTTATRAALVEITTAQGSTPREEGAWMLVSPNAIFGTIGGGQLEYMAIDKARQLLAAALPSPLREGSARSAGMGVVHQLAPHPFPYRGEPRVSPVLRTPVKYGERGASTSTPGFSSPVQAPAPAPPSPRPSRGSEGRARHVARPGTGKGEGLVRGKAQNPVDGKILLEGKVRAAPILLDIPLGPEIGQCCGGRVGLTVQLVDDDIAAALLSQAEAQDAALPSVYLFGGGHVGRALASAFSLLPVNAIVVETREPELAGLPSGVEARLTAMPEDAVRAAPAGSAFIVLTHDHALDFLIVAEALKHRDAAYIGMIGSKTKKATFRRWYMKDAGGAAVDVARLVCPIGGDAVKDKRPPVIAALAVAEVMTALANKRQAASARPDVTR